MSAPSADRRRALIEQILGGVDPRCRSQVEAPAVPAWPAPAQRLVLCGHRSAGKSTLLPLIAELTGRQPIDLDALIEARSGRAIREWFAADPASFRAAERETFLATDPRACIAVGGGFLALHADLLEDAFVVLLPVSFETYRDRLSADRTRPRLRPELSLDAELEAVFTEREALHARAPTVPLAALLSAAVPEIARRVVTLPPHVTGEASVTFAERAAHLGANLLELRTDLHDEASLPVAQLARVLSLLVSERDRALPASWLAHASLIDREDEWIDEPNRLTSLHAPTPLTRTEAEARWRGFPPRAQLKHVEPLGAPGDGTRLLELQSRLIAGFGPERVTVLATGPWALPFRALLARRNALDYTALDPSWAAAPGQRLLEDSRRAAKGYGLRRGILGSAISHSRSPRIHPPPFDRIDLPPDAAVGELVDALHPFYAGFAVTSPFKKPLAAHLGSELGAINTLVRRRGGWDGFNTDIDGARASLERLGGDELRVLGDGGATVALRAAAGSRSLRVLRQAELDDTALRGAVIWTWPDGVTPPACLRFQDARVGVIAYGSPGRRIAAEIRRRGGVPIPLGACWFVAQARRQRVLWENAR